MALRTTLAPRLAVTAQRVVASRLLRLSGGQLQAEIMGELARNPALERPAAPEREGTRLPRAGPRNWGGSAPLPGLAFGGDDPFELVASRESPLDHLLAEARLIVPSGELGVATYLIHSLDEHGFLPSSEESLARELGISLERVRRHVAWLQELEPPGIGARDLRECFLLQCAALEARGMDCGLLPRVLKEAWGAFAGQRWDVVARRCGCTQPDIDHLLGFMRSHLYPYPLHLLPDAAPTQHALGLPDLIIRRLEQGGKASFTVEVPAAQDHELRISEAFCQAQAETLEPAHSAWVEESIARARTFLDALDRRQATLRRLGEFLAAYQAAFFEEGPGCLAPMTRAEVAARLKVHESTISRAVSDKVLQLPGGRLIPLSDLFDRSLAAKEALRRLIEAGDGQLSDGALAAQLRNASFDLSRRTVAKYRAALGIPSARRRAATVGAGHDRHT